MATWRKMSTPTIDRGEKLIEVVLNYVPASQAIDSLAEKAGFIWWIDHERKLYFVSPSTYSAPWNLYPIDPVTGVLNIIGGTLSVESSNPKYRNIQYIKGGRAITDPQTEVHAGDGEAQSFPVGYPIAKVPTVEISLNGGAWTSQTVGIKGIDEGKQWYWTKGDPVITQDNSGTPLTSADKIRITYQGEFSIIIKSWVDEEILRVKNIEKIGSGKVEAIDQDGSIGSMEAGLEAANKKLSKWAKDNVIVTYQTERNGLKPGMIQKAYLPEHGLNGDELLIERVTLKEEDTLIIYEVTAVLGPLHGSWTKFFEELKLNSETVVREDTGEGQILILPLTFTKNWIETERPNIFTEVYPSETLYPSNDLYPMFMPENRVKYIAWFNNDIELGRKYLAQQTGESTAEITTLFYLGINDANTAITHLGWFGGWKVDENVGTGVLVDKQAYNATKTQFEAWQITKIDRKWV